MKNVIIYKDYIQYKNRAKDKSGDFMCTVLEKIRNKSAPDLLAEYGVDKSIPIDIKKLLKSIGISALGRDFTGLEKHLDKEEGSILGMLLSSGDNAAIFYRANDSLNRQKFTIVHELAHAMLHTDNSPHIEFRLTEKEIENSESEKKVNILAGELLIPLNRLEEEYMKLDMPSSIILARKFGTSINVMEKRLEHLGIFYYNENGESVTYGER